MAWETLAFAAGFAAVLLAGALTARQYFREDEEIRRLATLIYGVMQSAGHGWASAQVLGPAGAGLLLLVVFTVVEAHFATQPMMPLRLFRIRRKP